MARSSNGGSTAATAERAPETDAKAEAVTEADPVAEGDLGVAADADPVAASDPVKPARAVKSRAPERSPASARRPVLLVAAVLALAAAVAAALTGWSWYGAAHDGSASFAKARDSVLAAGEQAVQNMNTLDHNDLGHGLDAWEASTTGDLHTQLVQGRADFEKQVQLAQTDSTAKVLSGAVTELDTRAGKASVMVALQITVTAPKAKPSVKESRLVGELTRTASGWKLSALGQAPMGDGSTGDGSTAGAAPSGAATPTAPATTQPTSGR
ncbi:Mce-associated membrane protein [Actinacidiphila rubida]|uniref:Mce-associated membrane protein n=1 Tax=Actinacidiphila rubida TaxID=310780 RepID=A0A1H8N936_9ACTN|nr:Mce-associated membrane protein [Actinacidiphila rubida]